MLTKIPREPIRSDMIRLCHLRLTLCVNNAVHEDITGIINNELTGADAVRSIVVVDTKTNEARMRNYTVVADSEGDDENVYTYSGTFKANGEQVIGTATISDDGMTATFTPASE